MTGEEGEDDFKPHSLWMTREQTGKNNSYHIVVIKHRKNIEYIKYVTFSMCTHTGCLKSISCVNPRS